MDSLVVLVLATLFIGSLMLGHLAWVDRQDRRRNDERVARKYARPRTPEGRR